MAENVRDFSKTFVADAAITAGIIAKLTTAGCDIATAASDLIIGVVTNNPGIGEAANVQFVGTVKVVASAAITKGAWVTATTAGKAVTTTSDHAVVLGRALNTVTTSGDLVEVELGIFTLSA